MQIRVYYGPLCEKPRDMQDFFERWRCVWIEEDLLRSHEATAEHLCERYYAHFNKDETNPLSGTNATSTFDGQFMIRKLGVSHTVMRNGDIIEVDGRMYWVAGVGFEKLNLKPRQDWPVERVWLWCAHMK